MAAQTRWSLEALRGETGVGRLVMRSFVRDGLLPHPGFGRASGYGAPDRQRLLAIVKLRREGYRGAALKAKLGAEPRESPHGTAVSTASSISTWVHIVVAPGVELHIDSSRADASKAAAMIEGLGLKTT